MSTDPVIAPVRARRRRRRARAAIVAGVVAVTAGVVVTATLGLGGRDGGGPSPTRTGPAATTTVTRQTLTEVVMLSGTLTYSGALPLTSTATGTVTWLPASGTRIKRGQPLLRVNDEPVVLLYGALPMYRPLAEGTTGADVKQLESNLSALGYRRLTVDEEFTDLTTAAVKQWQKDLKLPETGTVEQSRVVYAPREVRIAQRLVRVGASAAADVLSYTGNTRVVTVTGTAEETAWAAKGRKVTVTLPNGSDVDGKVTGVSGGEPAQGGQAEGSPGGSGQADAGAMVTIGIADQTALGTLDAEHVRVRHVTKERKDVLTVPVGALLALAEGGYAVEVVSGGSTRIAPVTPGMFADGRVEISGAGVDAGTVVGLPA